MTIVKSQRVKPADPCRLGGQGSPAAGAGSRPRPASAPSGKGSVRILQQDAGGTVLEVTCPCGNVLRLNCLYADAGSGAAGA